MNFKQLEVSAKSVSTGDRIRDSEKYSTCKYEQFYVDTNGEKKNDEN